MKVPAGDIRIDETARKYVNQVLDSGRLSYGPFSRRFEQEFAKIHEVKHAVFCNSGTSALHLILLAMKEKFGWRDGDEVIVPALTFVATVNSVAHSGLEPVLVDVEEYTFTIDPAKVEEAITHRTRCIIPVHIGGLPADMKRLRFGIPLLEDSCEAMFATYNGMSVGNLGVAAAFSTYMAHYVVTGVGGIATTNDDELADIIRSLLNHGRDTTYLSIDDDDNLSGKELSHVVDSRFKFIRNGHSYRATEFEAALGLAQLENWQTIVQRRRQIARRLLDMRRALNRDLFFQATPLESEHSWMFFPVRTRRESKQGLVQALEASGVETRDLLPLVDQPAMKRFVGGRRFRVADALLDNAFYIPCHHLLTDEQVEHMINVMTDYFADR